MNILFPIFIAIMTISPTHEGNTGEIKRLWNKYEKAELADRPGDMLEILSEIKQQAAIQGRVWDFYDASTKYVQTSSSQNWKLGKELADSMDREVAAMDCPVMTFFHSYRSRSADEALAFVEENAGRLSGARNREFYYADHRLKYLEAGQALPDLIENDYEYTLWSIFSEDSDTAREPLEATVRGKYPFDFILALNDAASAGEGIREQIYRTLAGSCAGKAAALYAEAKLLELRFSELQDDVNSTEKDYIGLNTECERIIGRINKAAKSADTVERTLAEHVKYPKILKSLLSESNLVLSVQDDTLIVRFVNLKSARLEISKGSGEKVLFSKRIVNPVRSFFVPDTVEIPLAFLEDGTYSIKVRNGSISHRLVYNKHSLSLAIGAHSLGAGAYVTDFWTGEPCGELTLTLRESGYEIARASLPEGEGFREIPSELLSGISSDSYNFTLQASLRDCNGKRRMSAEVPIPVSGFKPQHSSERADSADGTEKCVIITDRSAFNPGETVHFKAVVYRSAGQRRSVAEGVGTAVRISDAGGEEFGSMELVTNQFGSVEGSFQLEEGRIGGIYTIRIFKGDRLLASKAIRVDEFVLPGFTLEWDDDARMLLCGDSPRISGRLKSFSGHTVDASRAEYRITRYGTTVDEGQLVLDSDGRFSFVFDTDGDEYGAYYSIRVSITDASGETISFEKGIRVNSELYMDVSIANADKGSFITGEDTSYGSAIVSGGTIEVIPHFGSYIKDGLHRPELKVAYSLTDHGGNVLLSGEGGSGQFAIDVSAIDSGSYSLVCEASAISDNGKEYSDRTETDIILMSGTDTVLHAGALSFFREIEGDMPAVQIGSGRGKVWAVAELYGNGNVRLDSKSIFLEGIEGHEGSLKTVTFERKAGYPDELTLSILFFKHARVFRYSKTASAPHHDTGIPLSLSRFTDEAAPSSKIKVTVQTAPDVECAASVFDLASESVMPNTWTPIASWSTPLPAFSYSSAQGTHSSGSPYIRDVMYRTMKGTAVTVTGNAVPSMALEMEEMDTSDSVSAAGNMAMPEIREEFSGTLCWEPTLRSNAKGQLEFSFNSSDKLSTYVLQLFAHDRNVGNATLREQMLITLPVRVNVTQPPFLFSSDSYTALVSLGSVCDSTVSGTLTVSFINGKYHDRPDRVISSVQRHITLGPRGSAREEFTISVPDIRELGLLASFTADGSGSDAMFVTIPVSSPVQTITEAHSALITDDASRKSVSDSLRATFVNAPADKAEEREIPILQMLMRDLPQKFIPESDNVLSLTEAIYANTLDSRMRQLSAMDGISGAAPSGRLDAAETEAIVDKILACRNADGGFGWFAGLPSSPSVTAVVLEWCADIADDCPTRLKNLLPGAAGYLDRSFFSSTIPYWRGGINLAEYLYTRSLYPELPIDFSTAGKDALQAFRKDVADYLVPEESRGLNAMILAKARRLRTIEALLSSTGENRFAASAGIRTDARLRRSLSDDLESLVQYIQPHISGGYYFPNAVMPFRGLLESELYAHSLLCDLLSDYGHEDMADGIRLWIMVQKETQQWESDFAYLKAMSSVMRGSGKVLSSRVLVMSASAALPLGEISGSGNGMSINAVYSIDGKPIEDGQILHVGDRIRAEYRIWNAENRSFVKVELPHSAALIPVKQLSGPSFYAYGAYRNVLPDRMEYWFESLPEETTAIVEEFHVTQAGVYRSGIPTAASYYAPHYRANGTGTTDRSIMENRKP